MNQMQPLEVVEKRPPGNRGLRALQWVHRWSSLICTIFLLVLCLTGLPLIFSEEIDHWSEPPSSYAEVPAGTPRASLDLLARHAREMYPGQIISSIAPDADEPQVYVWMAPSFEARANNPDSVHFVRFDAHTAQVLEETKPESEQKQTFMGVMLQLHVSFFSGFGGQMFLAAMGLLFTLSLLSGVILYSPFSRKLPFGTIRDQKSRRIRWLDLHNLLGIVLFTWMLVVGLTGVINELASPLVGLWKRTDVQAIISQSAGTALPGQSALATPEQVFEEASKALPGMTVSSIYFPGHPSGSPYHFVAWARGSSTLTSRLTTPVLLDGRTGKVSMVIAMPWYLRALEVSRPLHFGDYGGLPLKLLWAVLDLITIVVLVTGVYLWFAKSQSRKARRDGVAHIGEAATSWR